MFGMKFKTQDLIGEIQRVVQCAFAFRYGGSIHPDLLRLHGCGGLLNNGQSESLVLSRSCAAASAAICWARCASRFNSKLSSASGGRFAKAVEHCQRDEPLQLAE